MKALSYPLPEQFSVTAKFPFREVSPSTVDAVTIFRQLLLGAKKITKVWIRDQVLRMGCVVFELFSQSTNQDTQMFTTLRAFRTPERRE